jgi:hypothetical protein
VAAGYAVLACTCLAFSRGFKIAPVDLESLPAEGVAD